METVMDNCLGQGISQLQLKLFFNFCDRWKALALAQTMKK